MTTLSIDTLLPAEHALHGSAVLLHFLPHFGSNDTIRYEMLF